MMSWLCCLTVAWKAVCLLAPFRPLQLITIAFRLVRRFFGAVNFGLRTLVVLLRVGVDVNGWTWDRSCTSSHEELNTENELEVSMDAVANNELLKFAQPHLFIADPQETVWSVTQDLIIRFRHSTTIVVTPKVIDIKIQSINTISNFIMADTTTRITGRTWRAWVDFKLTTEQN